MDYTTADKLMRLIHLRKDWTLHWRRGVLNTMHIEIQGLVDNSSDFPSYEAKSIAHGTFTVDLGRVGGPLELTRVVLDALIEMATHEEREFLRLGPKGIAPFHPHTKLGEKNYKQVTSYRTKEPFDAVAVGTEDK